MFKIFSSTLRSPVSLYCWNCFSMRACTSVIHQHLFENNISVLKHKVVLHKRFASSHAAEPNLFRRVKKRIVNIIPRQNRLRIGGMMVYEKIADEINYEEFFKAFKLPDTFMSWFLAIQLHVWMCIIATISKEDGRVFRNSIVDAMWHDVELRLEKLAEMKSSTRKKYLQELVGQFQASLISYDEGILSNDAVLAASIWRTLYSFQHVDPELLENTVLYIRKQLHNLDTQHSEDIMLNGKVKFLPLKNIFPDKKM